MDALIEDWPVDPTHIRERTTSDRYRLPVRYIFAIHMVNFNGIFVLNPQQFYLLPYSSSSNLCFDATYLGTEYQGGFEWPSS